MKRRVIIALSSLVVIIAVPFVITGVEERRLRDANRILAEVGYSIPPDATIIGTEARIWSLADGANYMWRIASSNSLLSWVESIGRLEYERTYKVERTIPEGEKRRLTSPLLLTG